MQDHHAGAEYDLMVSGNKRLTYLSRWDPWLSYVGFVLQKFDSGWLVYKSEDYRMANCFIRSMRMFQEKKISLASAHARRGILLGYSRESIRKYVNGRGQWEAMR